MTREEIEIAARRLYTLFADPVAYRAAFSDDILWHVPGNNPVSGVYRGEQYFGLMPERMAPLDEWRFKVEDILVNERDRAALVSFGLTGRRKGAVIATTGFHVLRFDAKGRIVEGWGFTADQPALDAFFAA